MSVKPDWWYTEDEAYSVKKHKVGPVDTYNEHSDIKPKKRRDISSKFVKSDNQTIKELTKLLIEKTKLVENLERRIVGLESNNNNLSNEINSIKREQSKVYNENCVLRQIISDLDSPKKEVINNSLFLSENAPQEVVDSVWKSLSKLYHPDCGGSEEKMKNINAVRDEFYRKNNWK